MKTIKINCFGCRKKTSEISATLHIPMAGVWDDYNFNTIFRCDKIYFCDDCYNKIINKMSQNIRLLVK